ncbi:MAG: hypothetical protein E7670_04285 [Ruminococcaceae bacterium]|nr:hypothetical protein [Oscillospiraceae bacterium]
MFTTLGADAPLFAIATLKPMNPRGVKSGIRQLQKYNKALGGGFNLRLELY